jgi:hypothetical protein
MASHASATICASVRPEHTGTWKEWSALGSMRNVAPLTGQGGHHAAVGEGIALPLENQHRHVQRGQLLATLGRRLPGGVKRKPIRDQADNAGQRLIGLRLRRHACPERFAPARSGMPGSSWAAVITAARTAA